MRYRNRRSIDNPCIFILGRNSVVFSSHDTVDDSSEEPPPLPPRRPSTISGNSSLFNDSDPSSPTTRSPVNPNEVDLGLLQTFNDLFMLCSKCKAEGQSKSGFQRKKRASKKWAGQQGNLMQFGRLFVITYGHYSCK